MKTAAGGKEISDARHHQRHQNHPPPEPTELPTTCCDICAEDVRTTYACKLPCGTTWCQTCLTKHYEQSITTPHSNMPPKCCNTTISIKDAARFLDKDLQGRWNKAIYAFSVSSRLYCPRPKCSEWIKPSAISLDGKMGTCKKCGTNVCAKCKKEARPSHPCNNDDGHDNKILSELAKQNGWKQCWKCAELVSKSFGCNHMKCRCGAEFCYNCGTKYERGGATCDCEVGVRDIGDGIGGELVEAEVQGLPFEAFFHRREGMRRGREGVGIGRRGNGGDGHGGHGGQNGNGGFLRDGHGHREFHVALEVFTEIRRPRRRYR